MIEFDSDALVVWLMILGQVLIIAGIAAGRTSYEIWSGRNDGKSNPKR